jgi:hypothetical protein
MSIPEIGFLSITSPHHLVADAVAAKFAPPCLRPVCILAKCAFDLLWDLT